MSLYVDLTAEEEEPAQTRHVILKRPQATWAQSVFSVTMGDKVAPNRDYPYEGLSVLVEGENWKFLDALAISAQMDGQNIMFQPAGVRAYPWRYIYYYEAPSLRLSASYYLLRHDGEGISAAVTFEASRPITLRIEPLVDIRHMYDTSSPDEHVVISSGGELVVRRDEKTIILGARGVAQPWVRPGQWWYKLGSGARQPTRDGPVFTGEERRPISAGEIEVPVEKSTTLRISAAASMERARELLRVAAVADENQEAEAKRIAKEAARIPSYDPRVVFRALGAYSFGMMMNQVVFHEAGDFWFRTPWFRDVFEGLLHNIHTITLQPWGPDLIKRTLLGAFQLQAPDGRLPNRIPERTGVPMDYNSADSTLLAVLVAEQFLKYSEDSEVAIEAARHVHRAIEAFQSNSPTALNGAPVMMDDGLLAVPSWHSWTDAKRDVHGHEMPIRVPPSWEMEFLELGAEQEVNSPRWLLPEVNAQWIRALSAGAEIARSVGLAREEVEMRRILRLARKAYRPAFWDDERGFIYNLIYRGNFARKDETLGSPAVVAMSILRQTGIFDKEDVNKFMDIVHRRLLVKKWGLAFGVLVRESSENIFYGDPQYHEAVVWPRDTPYLLTLVDRGLRAEILEANLRHQMEEGFLFYNAELFSPGDGMIPVKNPVQWWSQWTDPFFI